MTNPGFGTPPTIATLSFTQGTQIGVGQGMNSEVHLVHDHQLDTQLAVKRVPKASFPNPAQFYNEARRLYDARHKHVVEVKYACDDHDYVYVAMPYYRGGTLQRLLDQRYLTVREILRYSIDFLSGLHHVHVRGLLHFDVKPTNVLLDDSNTAILADFGLSREVDAQGRVVIRSAYRRHIPPEWLSSARVARQADIYQAGVTLYRMCVGSPEFERQVLQHNVDADHAAIAAGAFPNRQRFLDHIPESLRKIVRRALELDPASRYPSVLDMGNALARVHESLDWSYQEQPVWGEGTWSESGHGSTRRVSLSRNGGTWTTRATRVSAAGTERQCSKFTAQGLSEKQARRLLRQALTKPWQ
jgi:eukaryotic-like serine/threonine-protein kinase